MYSSQRGELKLDLGSERVDGTVELIFFFFFFIFFFCVSRFALCSKCTHLSEKMHIRFFPTKSQKVNKYIVKIELSVQSQSYVWEIVTIKLWSWGFISIHRISFLPLNETLWGVVTFCEMKYICQGIKYQEGVFLWLPLDQLNWVFESVRSLSLL